MTVSSWSMLGMTLVNLAVLGYLARSIHKMKHTIFRSVAEIAREEGRQEGRDEVLGQLAGRIK